VGESSRATYIETLRCLIQGRVVLFDEVPANFVLRDLLTLCLLFWLSSSGSSVVWWWGASGIGREVLRVCLLQITSIGVGRRHNGIVDVEIVGFVESVRRGVVFFSSGSTNFFG